VVLGREPNAAGQNYWTALLQSGTNLANVVNAFFKSTEFTTTFVESYYATLFGRPADQAGLSYWTGVWARSGDTNALIAGFTSSSEYAKLHPTDQAFVQSLYSSILGRPGSDAELGYWQNVLAGGADRGRVAVAVATSDEALGGTIGQWYQTF